MNDITLDIPLVKIAPSRWQPRQQFDADELYNLAGSIRDQGLINPVLVFRHNGGYELIAGERRTRATCALALSTLIEQHSLADWCGRLAVVGLVGMGEEERAILAGDPGATIMASIRPADDMAALHLLAVTENLDRADLTPLEEAQAYADLQAAYRWTQRELAGRLNKSQGYVAQRLSLITASVAVREALNTRVITVTTARALAALPQSLQPAVTAWAVAPTTQLPAREVEMRAHQLGVFFSQDRYWPNPAHIYTPMQRNRLMAMRHIITTTSQTETLVNRVLTERFMSMQPLEIANGMFQRFMETLAPQKFFGANGTDTWTRFSRLVGKTCAGCIFENVTPAGPSIVGGHCSKWMSPDVKSCENRIGTDEPVVIPVSSGQTWLHSLPLKQGPGFAFTDDVAAYVAALETEAQRRKAEAEKQSPTITYLESRIAGLRHYWQHVESLEPEVRAHFQAHDCAKCHNYAPLALAEGLPPCQNVYGLQSGAFDFRAGALLDPLGNFLPRCRDFQYQRLPPIGTVGKDDIGFDTWARWMRYLIRQQTRRTWLSLLMWLPGDAKRDKNWIDVMGNLEGVVNFTRLFDVAISEAAALGQYERLPVTLVNAVTGLDEQFLGLEWDMIRYGLSGSQATIPAGWVNPWQDAKIERL